MDAYYDAYKEYEKVQKELNTQISRVHDMHKNAGEREAELRTALSHKGQMINELRQKNEELTMAYSYARQSINDFKQAVATYRRSLMDHDEKIDQLRTELEEQRNSMHDTIKQHQDSIHAKYRRKVTELTSVLVETATSIKHAEKLIDEHRSKDEAEDGVFAELLRAVWKLSMMESGSDTSRV
ncbi:MAG: hypothetical protein L6R41_002050 [Letrouitia leprolyta]|nr:MAG: hypothetical protein L6R41_002050 [Letrouitia leprolyta]